MNGRVKNHIRDYAIVGQRSIDLAMAKAAIDYRNQTYDKQFTVFNHILDYYYHELGEISVEEVASFMGWVHETTLNKVDESWHFTPARWVKWVSLDIKERDGIIARMHNVGDYNEIL